MEKKEQIQSLNEYHWFYEPDHTSIVIDLNFIEKIFKKALNNADSMTNLSKQTELSKQTLFNHLYCKSMNVKGLKALLEFTGIDFAEANRYITEIGWNKIKFPIQLSTESSAIVMSAILGDGSNTSRVMYKNKDQSLLDKIEKSAKEWLGEILIDHRTSPKNIPYLNFPRIMGRILSFAGVPKGKQTKSNPGIPEAISQSTLNVKKAFIQQFFDDEGWVEPNQMRVALSQCVDCTNDLPDDFVESIRDKTTIYLKDIPLDVKKKINYPKLLVNIHKILKDEFNIYSYLRLKRLLVRKNHITAAFELEIQRKEDIKQFQSKIGFYSQIKNQRLDFMINRDREFPQNNLQLIINEAIVLSKDKGYFLAFELAKALGYPQSPIRKRLNTLVKKSVFHKEKEKYYINIKI